MFRLVRTTVFVATLFLASNCLAEIHTGVGFLVRWDFSEQVVGSDQWDLTSFLTSVGQTTGVASGVFLWSNIGVHAAPQGTSFEDLTVAPTDPSQYSELLPFESGRVWVIWTREGHYAKIRFLDDLTLTNQFEFVYQDDGTPMLDATVATETATWGAIKAAFE